MKDKNETLKLKNYMEKLLKIFFIFLFSLIIFGLSKSVHANSISKISMDIYVDNNGTATVTETWNCTTSQGTESYHPYYNLGNSKIQNLTVSDNGTKYTTLSSWNTSGTLSSKANKCGLNKIANGVEICWGISSYGSHTYIVKYDITNFVSELTDSQMIYWTLIPYEFSNSIGEVDIKIYTDFQIADTIDVWGYGNYGGLAYVNNGNIYMKSDGRLNTSEYMTILVKFPSNTFELSNKLNHSFDYYYDMAEEGTTKYEESGSFLNYVKAIIFVIFQLGFYLFIPIMVMIFSAIKKHSTDFGIVEKIYPQNETYYRDIPLNGDIFKVYYIAQQYKLVKNKTDILGAIILKWLKEGIIKTENRGVGKIFKKEETVILLGNSSNLQLSNSKETELFHMMYVASKDGVLENKEFEQWCKKSYSRILGWFNDILREQRDILVKEGLVICEDKGSIFGKKYKATQGLNEEAMKIAGLKKYLLEYTLIKDRQAIEVELFEDYLIYAQILGIAKQVQKQFEEIYPNMIEETNFNSYDNLIYINYCASRGITSANSAKAAADRAAARSYSSGGGGFSSGGGGGGSFGGRRRRRRFPLIQLSKINMACLRFS